MRDSGLLAPPGIESGLTAVDSHTCGQQTRVLVAGLPPLEGLSVREARDRIRADHDWIRTTCTLEPRGHRSMFVAALVPASDPTCVQGVVFMDADGYPDMCGHATIGVATTLVELGWVDVDAAAAEVSFSLETPAGPIAVRLDVAGGRARSVAFRNQPAFHLETVTIPAPPGPIDVDVAFGGQWYAFVDASAFGLRVVPEQLDELIRRSDDVRVPLNARLSRPDPRTGGVPDVPNVVWVDAPVGAEADARNVPVSSFGAFDRSPCGTATCARLAVLYERGEVGIGEIFVNQSIVDTLYRARIVETTEVSGATGVIVEVQGSAWLTGSVQIWVDPADPLRDGFLAGR